LLPLLPSVGSIVCRQLRTGADLGNPTVYFKHSIAMLSVEVYAM